MSTQPSALAPGARVLIRDAEWIVKRVDRTGTGGRSVQVVGVSEIVRHKEARFLTEIEGKGITVLDPAETELVPDTSPQFRNSRLYLESLLRQSPPTGNDLWIGHRAAIDDLPYQLDPALLALEQTRQRILMADAVGARHSFRAVLLVTERQRLRRHGPRQLLLLFLVGADGLRKGTVRRQAHQDHWQKADYFCCRRRIA